jgi:hypothetical protein
MARTRFQSVLEALEEERFFISRRSPERDDVDVLGGFGMDDRERDTLQESQCYEALFVVREAIVLIRYRRSFKYARHIDEIETMLPEIGLPFPFIPGEAHMQSVYTETGLVNSGSRALTPALSDALLSNEEQHHFILPAFAPTRS